MPISIIHIDYTGNVNKIKLLICIWPPLHSVYKIQSYMKAII